MRALLIGPELSATRLSRGLTSPELRVRPVKREAFAANQDDMSDFDLAIVYIPTRRSPRLVDCWLQRSRFAGRTIAVSTFLPSSARADSDGLGFADYVTPKVSAEEVVVRARSVMQRYKAIDNDVTFAGKTTFSLATGVVKFDGNYIYLTPQETRLLECFVLRHGEIVTVETLSRYLDLDHIDKKSTYVYTTIAAVRRKVISAGGRDPFRAYRHFGYVLDL